MADALPQLPLRSRPTRTARSARHTRHHAVHLPGLARPDRHHPRGPGDGGGPERVRPPVLDRHRLPADQHRGHADHRQAIRQLGPAALLLPGLALFIAASLGLRLRADPAAADRRPRRAGARRRRADGDVAGRGGGRGLAARTRALPGLHGLDVGRLLDRRADRGRLGDRQPLLALDLLGQPADRPGGHGAVRPRVAHHPRPAPARADRLCAARRCSSPA